VDVALGLSKNAPRFDIFERTRVLNRWILALSMALAAASGQAQVVARDLDGNKLAESFLDQSQGLLWTRPGVVPDGNYSSALSAVASLQVEGLGGWQLPTLAQFHALYATQGNTSGAMRSSPFPAYGTWYWTTDVFDKNTGQNLAFSPGNGASMPFFRTTDVNVWAVRPVPEPASLVLMALGAAALLAWHRAAAARR
jgi:PEP-CTERM motif